MRPALKPCLAVAVVLYLGYLAWYHCPYAGGADSSGYLNSARQLLAGRLTISPRVPPEFPAGDFPADLWAPASYIPGAQPGEFSPVYPPGLPLHFAALGVLLGLDHATMAVSLLAMLGLLAATYALARDFGVRAGWALALTAALALSPVTLFMAVQPMSDVLAAAWVAAAVLAARRSVRHAGWAAAAGGALALAVLVRPTNALAGLPIMLCLGASRRRWLAFLLAGLPGAGLLVAYNFHLYGSALATGYGHFGGKFGTQYVLPSLRHLLTWLPVALTPLVFAAAGLPRQARVPRLDRAVLALWFGAFAAFYSAYAFTAEEWWYLRFLLPAFPPLLIAAALVLQDWRWPVLTLAWEHAPAKLLRWPSLPLVLVASFAWLAGWSAHWQVHKVELDERPYRQFGEWVERSLPPGALLAADQTSGALVYYSHRPFVRWDAVNATAYAGLNRYLQGRNGELYAGLFPFEETAALTRHLPGTWERVARYGVITVWRRTSLTPAPLPAIPSP